MTGFEEELICRITPELMEMRQRKLDMIKTHDIKLGRWMYCKYCYKSVRPEWAYDHSIVVCSCCEYGIATLEMMIPSYKNGDE